MSASTHQIREDFDRIALLTERHEGGGASDAYFAYLMRQLPLHLENALEIGCGGGSFTRLLAARAQSVIALDLSPEMLRLAQAHTANCRNITYRLDDIMQLSLPAARFDCIVSIATLHHLPLAQALLRMKRALKPTGTLILHDLIAGESMLDSGLNALAYPLSTVRRVWKTGRIRMPREIRQAWTEHGRNEVYLTSSGVKEMCRRYLPKALVKRHLFWRYTVVWRKPGTA